MVINMNKKTTGIVAYLTWVGLLVAFLAGDKEDAKFHLNQALVIWLAALVNGMIGKIPLIGGFVSAIILVFLFICFLIGLIGAIKEEENEIPVLGAIKILS